MKKTIQTDKNEKNYETLRIYRKQLRVENNQIRMVRIHIQCESKAWNKIRKFLIRLENRNIIDRSIFILKSSVFDVLYNT